MALKCPHDPKNYYKPGFCKKIHKTEIRAWCKKCHHFNKEVQAAPAKVVKTY